MLSGSVGDADLLFHRGRVDPDLDADGALTPAGRAEAEASIALYRLGHADGLLPILRVKVTETLVGLVILIIFWLPWLSPIGAKTLDHLFLLVWGFLLRVTSYTPMVCNATAVKTHHPFE